MYFIQKNCLLSLQREIKDEPKESRKIHLTISGKSVKHPIITHLLQTQWLPVPGV